MNKLQMLLKQDHRFQAGLCFLAACNAMLMSAFGNWRECRLRMKAAVAVANLIALRLVTRTPKTKTPGRDRVAAPVVVFFCLCALLTILPATSVVAQSASPTPTVEPSPPPPFEAGNPSTQLSGLLNHVRELIPYIRRVIERPLLQKFKTLAMVLGSLVLLFSFIRVIRENDGASQELYWWVARAAIFMAFFALAPSIVSTLYKIGRTLTIPIESGLEDRRAAFNTTYYEFVHGTYIVRDDQHIDIDPIYLKPGEDGWVGVLTDGDAAPNGKMKGIAELEKSADLTSWDMKKLFFGLSISRGILEAADIFLIMLGGFIMVALRLAAPFMIVIAIDKKLAERITYPFVWGLVVFTLVFPVVRDVLTYIAYTVGSFGLMMYKGEALYKIDDTTGGIIQSAAYYNPNLVIIMSLVMMTICGLMLWLSPYLSYRIATGQVFEAVSSTASGWMASIVGSAVEFAGLKAGASLQRQAENTQTQAGWQAELTRAKGTLDVSNLGAQARKVSGIAGIQGGLTANLGAIAANRYSTVGTAMQMRNFTVASTNATVGDSQRQTGFRRDQSIGQNNISYGKETTLLSVENEAKKGENAAQMAGGGLPFGGGSVVGLQGFFAQSARNKGQNSAADAYRMYSNINEFKTSDKIQGSQKTYGENINTAADNQYAGLKETADKSAGIAAGAAKSGAGTAMGGVNKAYDLEMQGNQIQFDTTRSAAGTIKDAGLSAAKMREVSTVISGMARDMDRRIEEGMRQRY